MANIQLQNLSGISPKSDRRLLPDNFAQKAENCRLKNGSLDVIIEPIDNGNLSAATKTIFLWRYINESDTEIELFVEFPTEVSVAQSAIADDEFSRFFWTGNADGKIHVKLYDKSLTSIVTYPLDMVAPPPITGNSAASVLETELLSKWIGKRFTFLKSFGSGILTDAHADWSRIVSDTSVASEIDQLSSHSVSIGTNFGDKYENTIPGCGSAPGCAYVNRNTVSIIYDGTEIPLPVDPNVKPVKNRNIIPSGTSFTVAGVGVLTVSDSSLERKFHQMIIDWSNVNASWNIQIVSQKLRSEWTIVYSAETNIGEEGLISYVYTYVSKYGEESAPSEPAEFEKKPGSHIELDLIIGTASVDIDFIRIYRTNAGSTSGRFRFVAEVANANSTFTDKVPSIQLAEELPVTEPPPDNLECLVVMPGGIFAAFVEKQLYFSDPYKPYSWPDGHNLAVDFFIVCLRTGGTSLYVLTKGHPYIVFGGDPTTLAIEKIMNHQACVSKKSVGGVGNLIFYASPDGLFAMEGNVSKNLTEELFTRREWQAIDPPSIETEAHDQSIFIVTSTDNYILNVFENNAAALVTTDESLSVLFSDLLDDTLYYKDGTDLMKWAGGVNPLIAEWRSKQIEINKDMHFSCARVVADAYPVTFRLYKEDDTFIDIVVNNERAFRLPTIVSQDSFSIAMIYTKIITLISMATSVGEL